MGNVVDTLDPRAHFNGGFLFIKTTKPNYLPGEFVQGNIYIVLQAPINARDL